MNHLIYKNPLKIGGESLMDYCFSNLFYEPQNLKQDNYWYDESDNEIKLEIDVPGFDKSDIDIDYKNNYLTIKANKSVTDSKKRHLEKCFKILNIDIKKSKANLENGVLKLNLEKQGTAKNQQLKIS